MKTIECKNAYYFRRLNTIGGIESHLNYISKKYSKKYDITIFYQTADPIQLKRLKRLVRCVQLTSEIFVKCDTLFCCFNREILDQCEAKKKYLVLHGDYKDMAARKQLDTHLLPIDERVEYLGVSQLVCDSWNEITGLKARNVYQPVELDKCDEPIMLISATRLSLEKGHERMRKLAMALDGAGVNYQWFIYTDTEEHNIDSPNVHYLKPRLDIADKVGGYTAFVQLSDNEGYCLSVVESLKRGTPVICTRLKVLEELSLNENNSIMCDFDMKDINIERIKELPSIKRKMPKYQEPADKWSEVLAKGKPTYLSDFVKVRATDLYKKMNTSDVELGHIPMENEIFYCDKDRYEYLHNHKLGAFVERVK